MEGSGRRWAALAAWLLACYLAAAVGGAAGGPGAWYASLAKPAFNPPGWVFGPVWTLLYGMMGVAAWLVWLRRRHPLRPAALALFAAHLVPNAAWSWLFFGMQRPDLAFAGIVVLWAAIAVLVVLFWRVRPAAGALLVPYLAWVSFASVLNYTIWRMNAGG
jgi:translocator protein